jgi:hypothetical protein
MLKKDIKKSLIETKEKQEKLLIEQKLINSRIMMIIESKDNLKNFHLLSEEKKFKMSYSIFEEIGYIEEQGLMTEQVWDFLGKIFGSSVGSIAQTMVEPIVNSILSAMGLGGYFKDFLVSLFTKNPLKLAKALTNCEELTKLIAQSLAEAVAMMILRQQGLEGKGYAFLRNALGDVANDTKFAQNIEKQISGIVCGIFGKMNDKASNVYTKLKSSTGGESGIGGLLGVGA